jgi:copper homeostasis protein
VNALATPVLEVIACSVADAVAAEKGGAGRLELVRALEAGGLTPPISLVKEIVAAVSIPVRVMLRENDGFEIADRKELTKLCNSARELAALEINGVVLGFLRGRSLDLATAQQILSCAPLVKATFHRAFEELENQQAAVATLKTERQFDRILLSPARVSGLKQLVEGAAPELIVIAGAGIDRSNIRQWRESTPIREFHVGRAARLNGDIHRPVDAALVEELAALVAS